MRNINNIYLVKNEIENRENISAYRVKNLQNNKRYILYIIENGTRYDSIQEYILTKFRTIKNLNFKNLVNILGIEKISIIDNIKLDRAKYGYLTEDIKETVDIYKFIESSSVKERLEVFIEIAGAINTLNMKGYIFDDISFNDIKLIKDDEGNLQIKINNIMEYEINKLILSDVSNINSLPYPYNIKDKEENNIKDNISQVVKIFNLFFSAKDLNTTLKALKNINTIYNKINNFSKSIKDFISYINEKMNTEYPLFDYKACNKMQTDIDIVGMEEELNIVAKNIKSILENKKQYKIIGFNGGIGSGKTRLMNEIRYRIDNKYFSNILYLNGENEEIQPFLKNVQDKKDMAIVYKYKKYLKEFLLPEDREYTDKEKFKIINRVTNFIYEFTLTNPIIILIDNLEYENNIMITFIRYLIFSGKKIGNFMIIFSMNERECSNSIIRLHDELKKVKEYEEYKINYLNQYNINEMIRNMLSFGKNSNKLATELYYKTLGNPLFTMGVVEELYENGTLFFDKKTCGWKITSSITDVTMPKKLVKKLKHNLENLSEEEFHVLRSLCIYKSSLSENIILNEILQSCEEYESYYSLKKKGFLINKISDIGMLIGFSNNLLKNLLYIYLKNDIKDNMHKKACILFEDILIKTDYYIDELLFQLEKSGNTEKLYFYTMVCGEAADIMGDTLKSIEYYRKALMYCEDKKCSEITLIIAKLYMRAARNKEAYKYFSKANEYAVKDNNQRIQIYALIEMVIIKIKNNVFIDLTYPLMIVKQLLNSDTYIIEEAYYYYACALNYKADFDDGLAYSNAIKALEICEKNKINDEIYGSVKLLLSELLLKNSKINEAKNMLNDAEEIFKDKNNINEYLNCRLRSISYFNTNSDIEEVLENYIEINKISNKYKIYTINILSNIYIAYMYIGNRQYNEAEKYLIKAMDKQREEGLNNYSFKIFNNLCLTYTRLGKIGQAIKYYYLTVQIKDTFRLNEDDIIDFSAAAIEYNSLIYNFDKARIYSEDIYGLIDIEGRTATDNLECKYYEFRLSKCKSEDDIRELYSKLNEKIDNLKNEETKMENKISIIRKILDLGYENLAKELFFSIDGYPNEYETEAKYIYLEFCFRYENYYNFLINKALRICVFINKSPAKAELYCVIAEYYEKLNCNLLALTYYYESLEIYIDIISELLDSDKICYVNNSMFLKVRRFFVECLKNLKIDMKFEDIDVVKTNDEIDTIIKELYIENLIRNNKLHKLMEDFYEKCYCNNLNNIYKVFESFSNNIVMNLNNVIKYMARITLANKALLVLENDDGENNIISMYRISDINEINYYLSLNNESMSESLLVCSNRNIKSNENILRYGLKSCLYLKLKNSESRKNIWNQNINAKLILTSDNSINYINSESRKIVEEFVPFLIFLLENYNLSVNSTLDRLTGAYNRKYFEDAIIRLLDNSSNQYIEKFSVIMFDIDDFKGVNDKYGHQKGDEILIKLVKEVKNTLSKRDILCRYGGEEFIILLPNTDEKQASIIAELVRANIENAKLLGDKRTVTISLGIAVGTSKSANTEELIKKADEALYMAKYNGRNRVEVWKANCGVSNNIKNNLTGVISGNPIKDYNIALILKEIINLVISKNDKSYKINEFILRVMEVIECEMIGIFTVKDNKIVETYTKQRGNGGVIENIEDNFQGKLIYESIRSKKGKYLVDWDDIRIVNSRDIPEWKSICLKPVVCNGEVVAVIYLSISVSEKEYTINDYNMLTCLAESGIALFY